MPDQLDQFQSFESRTDEIKKLINLLIDATGSISAGAKSLYEKMEWGQLSNAVLYSALLQMKKEQVIYSAEDILSDRNRVPKPPSGRPSTAEEPEEVSETWIRRRQPVITKDISWFINNGDTNEIKQHAREYRERVLLDLYMEHVKLTGETYFPEMHRLLKAEWDFSYKSHGD